MHRSLLLAVAAAALLGCDPVLEGKWSECKGEEFIDRDARIRACTWIIESGRVSGEKLAVAHLHRAVMRQYAGAVDLAMQDYDQAIRLKPDYADAFNSRGTLYADKGDLDRAVQDYNEAIRLNPEKRTLAWALYNRGQVYAERGQHERAIEDYDRAIKAMLFTRATFARGQAYFALGQYERAIEDFNTTIRYARGEAKAFAARAAAYMSKGEYSRAVDDFAQAHKLAPTDSWAVLYLHMARRAGQATSDLQASAAKLDKSEWPMTLIRLYLGEIGPDEVLAEAHRGKTVEIQRRRLCEAYFHLGQIALMRGDREEARRLFGLAADQESVGEWEHHWARAELARLAM
jgi:lipoprotein NlpI